MIRATAISVIDQGLLSGINFLLALVLIHFATQEDYGLYTQLIGLQALFSVPHAALFVSAYLALLPGMSGDARRHYQAGMARAEMATTLGCAVIAAVATWAISNALGHAMSFLVSASAALALLGLWWREFARARYFAEGGAMRVLRLDVGYAVLVVAGIGALVALGTTSAANVLWCMGIAGTAIALVPLARQSGLIRIESGRVRENLVASWQSARWEMLISLVTWGHAQSFVYFAALQGGLRAAAEISAARLITMPLALVWLSFANILRPEASRLLAAPDTRAALHRLAARAALFVVGLAVAYSLVLLAAMPLIERYVFDGKFEHLEWLSSWWLAYFALTGMTTIATSVLRSAFEFRALFRIHFACGFVAVAAFCAGLAFETPVAFVIVLVCVEVLLASLCWRQLLRVLSARAPAPVSAIPSVAG